MAHAGHVCRHRARRSELDLRALLDAQTSLTNSFQRLEVRQEVFVRSRRQLQNRQILHALRQESQMQTEDLREVLMKSLVKWKLKSTAWCEASDSDEEVEMEGAARSFKKQSLPSDLKLWAHEKLSALNTLGGDPGVDPRDPDILSSRPSSASQRDRTINEVAPPAQFGSRLRPSSAVGRHGSFR